MKRFFWMALLLLPGLLRAQEGGLTVDADFLTRGEYRYGGMAPDSEEAGQDRAAFILERTRLGAGYERGIFTGRVTAQHSGTWGGADDGVNLREAWVQFNTKPGIFVKLGRQGLAYDDQRIFGNDDWAMTGYSHDVLKAGWEGYGQKVHLIAAYNQNPDNMDGGSYYAGGGQPYKSMQALWYHCDIPSWHLGASAVFMNVGMQGGIQGEENEMTHHQQLAGGFLSFRPDRWSVEAAYYHQMGKDEGGLPINAWMASGRVQAAPSAAWQVYAGYDYLSGDPEFPIPGKGQVGIIRHETVRGFNSIFGSHHKFYGAMDFFYVTTYVNGFTPGLQNAYAGCNWKPLPVLSLDASYHFFAAATRIEDGKKPLGHEVELSASWSFLKDASLSLGYSWMQGTETMELLKRASGGRHLQWAWLMLSVSPTLFQRGK
jgi:hypothetical protein